jgi:putative spermidine/putrescine transport system ATP-binding protein
VVRIEHLRKNYGSVKAVDDLSLTIPDGAFVTLLGPSGSGKTTTLMMLAGFEYPDSGDIVVNEKSLVMTPPYKRNIGMVFQNYALFPHLTIHDNIAFPLKMRRKGKGEIEKMVHGALDMVRLRGLEKRFPDQLSGGQQQRVALARALVFDPPLLLMDEPLGALDKKLREQLQLEIKHIQEAMKKTIVYVTHDQGEALTMSTEIAVMNAGRIEQIGSPGDVYERPCNQFVADFIGESNFLTGRVEEADGSRMVVRTDGNCRLVAKSDDRLPPGSSVTVSVRPEKVDFLAADAGGERQGTVTVHGVVREIIYMGDFTKWKVQVGDDEFVGIKKPSNAVQNVIQTGGNVTIGWSVADGRVFVKQQ